MPIVTVSKKPAQARAGDELAGLSRMVIDAVVGVTDVVENMHETIASTPPVVGTRAPQSSRGITGLVYRSVRGITRIVGSGLDLVLNQISTQLPTGYDARRREAARAALNGLFGDYLEASGNPLAITMRLRHGGVPLVLERTGLQAQFDAVPNRLVILVHGLCMNDLQWQRDGHEHGAALAAQHGYTALHLHYNSGRSIAGNGRAFAALLADLLREWPTPVDELLIVGHSMGGLVARSACHYAERDALPWLKSLRGIVCLGTPHLGAPLERAGDRVDRALGVSPYTAPIARLGKIRSAGIQDLRHGSTVEDDWQQRDAHRAGSLRMTPLPAGVPCLLIAATTAKPGAAQGGPPPGDGLVPVASALGQHHCAERSLAVSPGNRIICHGLNHFDLLGSREVFQHMSDWLANAGAQK
jgi:pimeloyl-ACP methyl ester carboxylesterase